MKAASSASDGIAASCTTQQPPFSSGPQSSSVDASKATDDIRPQRLSGPKRAKPGSTTRRCTPRCGTTTPLGAPVVPDVNITYSGVSPGVSGQPGTDGNAGCCSARRTSSATTVAGTVPSSAAPVASTSHTGLDSCASIARRRPGGLARSIGAYAAPQRTTASAATTNSGERPSSSGTTWPLPTPCERSCEASRPASASRSR
jgi:hypothetical protein